MSVDSATVRRIAHLARIKVEDKEVEHLQGELNAILAFVEELSKIDVEGVEPEVLSGARRIIEASPKCAFHIEVHAFWESQYGSVKAVLEPISLNRSIFLMKPNGTIAPVAIDDIADYAAVQPGGIADVFICPAHEDYIWRVSSYMDR